MGVSRQPDTFAARIGLRWGVAAAVLGAGIGVASGLIQARRLDTVVFLPCLVLGILIMWTLGETGHSAARRTGSLGSGTLAAALAGGLGSLGFSVGSDVTLFVVDPTLARLPSAVLIGSLVALILNACIFAGLGAICGVVGASIGKDQFLKGQVASSPSTPQSPPEMRQP
jgi:hypothetical protein